MSHDHENYARFDKIRLDQHRFNAQVRMTKASLEGMTAVEFAHMEDMLTDRLVYTLQGAVYGHKTDTKTVQVPFNRERPYATTVGRMVCFEAPKWCVLPFVAGVLAYCGGMVAGLLPVMVIGAIFMVAAFMRAYDERTEYVEFEATGTLEVFGTADVEVDLVNLFPRSKVQYPPNLGPAVFMPVARNKGVRYDA
jgi:hypothetical protein